MRSHIHESGNIRDVLKIIHPNSFVIFDIDNTILRSDTLSGSHGWFAKMIPFACEVIANEKEAMTLVLAIYNSLQNYIDAKPVENGVIYIINALQDIGVPVLFVTSRGPEIISATFRQLEKNNVHPTDYWGADNFYLEKIGQSTPAFASGILFCDGADKGTCFEKFLQYKPLRFAHLCAVDDQPAPLKSFELYATRNKKQFDGLRYSYMDKETANFDLKAATQELANLKSLLASAAQTAIEKLSIASYTIFKQENNSQAEEERQKPLFYFRPL